MKIIKVNNIEKIIYHNKKPIIAMWGFFDGWHKGHQTMLKQLKLQAKKLNYQTLVISFDIKPQAYLHHQKLPILFDKKTKQDFLRDSKIDNFWELTFNNQVSKISAEDFVTWLIKNNVKAVLINHKIRFGFQGKGDINTLKKSLLQIFVCENVFINNQLISSTFIKSLLSDKNISDANAYLDNFPYTISGTVVHGIKEGRTLGFPTANLMLRENYALPGYATYITLTNIDGKWYRSLTIIIERDHKPLVETYILDFKKDLYGKTIKVRFLKYLRDNINFSNKTLLVEQITDDENQAKKYFQNYYRENNT